MFSKNKDRTVPTGNVFKYKYRENKGSKMQEISLIQKSMHWFINKMVVKKRDTRGTDDFSPLVNRQVPSNIRKLVSIVKMIKKEGYTLPIL